METYEIIRSSGKGFWNIINEAGQTVLQGIKGKVKANRLVKELLASEKRRRCYKISEFYLVKY